MRHYIKEFYYLYNFFDLYKSSDLSSVLLLYKKADWNTGSVKDLGYAFADDCMSTERESKRISSILVSEVVGSILLGLDNRAFNHDKLAENAVFLKNILIDFRNSLWGLVDAELLSDIFYFDDDQSNLIVKVLILELKKKYPFVNSDDNIREIIFIILDKYSLRIFDLIFWIYRSESSNKVHEHYSIRDVIIKHPILINKSVFKQFIYDEEIDDYRENVIYEDKKLASISVFDAINTSAFTDESTVKYTFEMERYQSLRNRFEQKVSLSDKVLSKNELSLIKGKSVFDEEFTDTYFDDIINDVLDGNVLEEFVEYIFNLIDVSSVKKEKIIDFYYGIAGMKIDGGGNYQPVDYVPLILHPLFLCLKRAMIFKMKNFETE